MKLERCEGRNKYLKEVMSKITFCTDMVHIISITDMKPKRHPAIQPHYTPMSKQREKTGNQPFVE